MEQDVKTAFVQGFYDMLKDEKLDDIRVEKLCRRVGFSKKSFYNYFRDKYNLAQFLYDKIIADAISVEDYYVKLSEGDEKLNNADPDSIQVLKKIFFSLRNTHKEISDHLVNSDDYNSPQQYFDRQSICGRKRILLKRLESAGKKLNPWELELAGKLLYQVAQESFSKWDCLYKDDLPDKEAEELVVLTNDLINFFVKRGKRLFFS